MSGRWWSIAWFVLGLMIALPRPGQAVPKPSGDDQAAWVWLPVLVYRGVDPKTLVAEPPYVPDATPIARGEIQVAPGEASLAWIDGFSTLRVRKIHRAQPGKLRFHRLHPGREHAQAWVEVDAVVAGDGVWLLHHPEASGGPWLITSDATLEIAIEEPSPRQARLIWDHAQDEMAAWVEAGGDMPRLPPVIGSDRVARDRRAERELAERIAALPDADKLVGDVAFVWRLARARAAIDTLRPLMRPGFAPNAIRPKTAVEAVLPHRDLGLRGVLGQMKRNYFYYTPQDDWVFETKGPAVARVDVRAMFPPGTPERRLVTVLVRDETSGQIMGRLDTIVEPSRVRDPESNGEVFPRYIDATTSTGTRLSNPFTLNVALPFEKRKYRIEINGPGAVIKAVVAEMVPRGLDIGNPPSPKRRLKLAKEIVDRRADLPSAVLRYLVGSQFAPVPPLPPERLSEIRRHDVKLAAWLELDGLARIELTSKARVERVHAIVEALGPLPLPPNDLDVLLRVLVFEQFMAADRPDLAVEALRDHVRWLDHDEFEALVFAVLEPKDLWPIADAMEIVGRAVPLAPRLRRAYRALWSWTRWAPLAPPDDAGPIAPWRWIEPPPPGARPQPATDRDPDALWPVPLDVPVTLEALPHEFEEDRTPLLRVHVYPRGEAPRARASADASIELRVGERTWSSPIVAQPNSASPLPLSFEVAVPPGLHEVQVRAPPGTLAYATMHPPRTHEVVSFPAPTRSTMWPHRTDPEGSNRGRPVAFELDPLPAGGLLRVDLRVLPPLPTGKDIEVWVRSDDGLHHRVTLRPGPADPDLLPNRASTPASPRMSVVVPLSKKATRAWVETEDDTRLAVSMAVRRWELPDSKPDPAEHFIGNAYARIEELTRKLHSDPDHIPSRIQRAHRLLDVGAYAQARIELRRIVERLPDPPTQAHLAAVVRLQARLDAYVSDEFIEIVDPQAVPIPTLLQPLIAAIEPPAAAVDAALAGAPDADRDVATALAMLRDPASVEQFRALSQRYALHDRWVWGYAAAVSYAQVLRLAPGSVGAQDLVIAYGVASRVRAVIDSPWLRWLYHRTARATRWERLRLVESSGGTIFRPRSTTNPELSDADRLQWALLAPPWPADESMLLRPGESMGIDLVLSAPGDVNLEVWCDDLDEVDIATAAAVEVGLRIGDRAEPEPLVVPLRTVTQLRLQRREGALHFEIAIPAKPASVRCTSRWSAAVPVGHKAAQTGQTGAETTLRWFLARHDAPVDVVVLGPTTVDLELRPANDEANSVKAFVEQRDVAGTVLHTTTFERPWPRLDEADVPSQEPLQTSVIVIGNGPQRLRVGTHGAPVLVRLAARQAERLPAGPPKPAADGEGEGIATDVVWPAPPPDPLTGGIAELVMPTENPVGTASAEVRFSRTDVRDVDEPMPRNQVRGTVGWRREMVSDKIWMRLHGYVQGRQGAGAAGGGSTYLHGQLDPRRLNGRFGLAFWGEQYRGRPAWSARVMLDMARPIQLWKTMSLVPAVDMSVRYQSLDHNEVVQAVEGTHSEVFNEYIEDHPFELRPSVALRWRPFQDLLLVGTVAAVPNSDLASLDHFDVGAETQGLIGTPIPLFVRYRGGYEQSYRLRDEHRNRFFVRHGLDFGVGLTYAFSRVGRLNFDLLDTLYLSVPYAPRNAFDVVLSFDFALGRGIRDVSPQELNFRELYRFEWWEETVLEPDPL